MSSGLYTALITQAQALGIQQKSIEIIGQNIANVNNPQYSRQKVNITTEGTVRSSDGVQNMGIKIDSIVQNRSVFLDEQIVKDTSRLSYYEAQEEFNSMVETAIGDKLNQSEEAAASNNEPDNVVGSAGIGAAISRFFNAVSSLATTPDDSTVKNKLFNEASSLVDQFHTVSERLTDLSDSIDDKINTDVDKINTLLSQVAEVNEEIDRAEVETTGTALDLRDKRQALLEELAGYINFHQSKDDEGRLQVAIYDEDGNDLLLVDNRTVKQTVSYDSTRTATDEYAFYVGEAGSETWLDTTGGTAHGAWKTKTGVLKDLSDEMDTLASNLVTEFNSVYSGTVSGNNFFNSTGTTAATIDLDSTLTSGSDIEVNSDGSVGNNDIMKALEDLGNSNISGLDNKTFHAYYVEKVTDAGNSINNISLRKSNMESLNQLLEAKRQAYGGVSINEEVTDLMRYQRSFQSISRVISVMNSLLEAIVNLGRL
ncbi:MAG: flagellar hook-associated protein FlgK [Verrucomicrobia bacterium GWF2_51_19]|nr:MAG: flagellar hook-associated protein FlgK [Verrucomicrobia bacterium GWF2_51_19]HCJ12279.1 flagellar hook-associated protein FlgK [Opitutae bacterium]